MIRNKLVQVAHSLYGFLLSSLTLFSPRLNTRLRYRVSKGRKIDLRNPVTFNERISWLKLHVNNHSELVGQCSDKYRVRAYVRQLGLEEILVPLYAVYDSVDEIEWDTLPDQYVIKWTTGAGDMVFCDDRDSFDPQTAVEILGAATHLSGHRYSAELQYEKSPRRLICEKLIIPSSGTRPADYKIYCYSGEPKFILLYTNRGEENTNIAFYDTSWNRLTGIKRPGFEAPDTFEWPKPVNLDQSLEYARLLSQPFPFVRVDMYLEENRISFGELTFTPCGGVDSNLTNHGDLLLGKPLAWLFESIGE